MVIDKGGLLLYLLCENSSAGRSCVGIRRRSPVVCTLVLLRDHPKNIGAVIAKKVEPFSKLLNYIFLFIDLMLFWKDRIYFPNSQ